jgi:heme/copper-type cytochrome/quinol oxidase subunit 3
MDVPYTIERRPDTGLYNAQLGIWLFIASEVMLFGALFSGYALIRTGADVWPRGLEHLDVRLGSINTALLLASSVTMALAVRAFRRGAWRRGRLQGAATCVLALTFLAIKGVEYREHLIRGELPSTDNFFAIYYTLTGLHALHVLGGLIGLAYLVGPGASLRAVSPNRYAHRAATTSFYWQFVDVIWILVFVTVYLS